MRLAPSDDKMPRIGLLPDGLFDGANRSADDELPAPHLAPVVHGLNPSASGRDLCIILLPLAALRLYHHVEAAGELDDEVRAVSPCRTQVTVRDLEEQTIVLCVADDVGALLECSRRVFL